MYKRSSDTAQRQATQLWLRDLVGDCKVVLTPEQERENLVAQVHAIEKQLSELPTGRKPTELRASLGKRKMESKRKMEIQQAITAIRPKLKGPRGVGECFIAVCKEQLPAMHFQRLMDEAVAMAKQTDSGKIPSTTAQP
jgi:hypothetical protein